MLRTPAVVHHLELGFEKECGWQEEDDEDDEDDDLDQDMFSPKAEVLSLHQTMHVFESAEVKGSVRACMATREEDVELVPVPPCRCREPPSNSTYSPSDILPWNLMGVGVST